MEKTELLLDFVEGKLDPLAEQELFASLNHDESLRAELQNIYSVKQAARATLDKYAPSATLTGDLFSRLGIDNTPIAPWHSTLFTEKVKGGLVGAFAMATLLIGSFWIFRDTQTTGIDSLPDAQQKSDITINLPDNPIDRISNPIPLMMSSESQNKVITPATNRRMETAKQEKKRYGPVPLQMIESQAGQWPDHASVPQLMTGSNDGLTTQIPFVGVPFETMGNSNNILGIELQAGSFQSLASTQAFADGLNAAGLTGNFLIAASMPLTSNIKLGVDFRRELFHQSFIKDDGPGHTAFSEVNALGISATYETNINNRIVPFINIVASGSNAGFISRGMLGTRFRLNESFALAAGIEYSNLFYNYSGKWLNSDKLNVRYSVVYKI